MSCAGSVVLTQTHPAAPYVCRTGNITLRCQYDNVEGVVVVLWSIGNETGTANPSAISGHTTLPRTSTYQEVVVDTYTNLSERYQCAPGLINGTSLNSAEYEPQIECKHKMYTLVYRYSYSCTVCVAVVVYIQHVSVWRVWAVLTAVREDVCKLVLWFSLF